MEIRFFRICALAFAACRDLTWQLREHIIGYKKGYSNEPEVAR
jgi:hypothetical protein